MFLASAALAALALMPAAALTQGRELFAVLTVADSQYRKEGAAKVLVASAPRRRCRSSNYSLPTSIVRSTGSRLGARGIAEPFGNAGLVTLSGTRAEPPRVV
jgi:hypothetical protein